MSPLTLLDLEVSQFTIRFMSALKPKYGLCGLVVFYKLIQVWPFFIIRYRSLSIYYQIHEHTQASVWVVWVGGVLHTKLVSPLTVLDLEVPRSFSIYYQIHERTQASVWVVWVGGGLQTHSGVAPETITSRSFFTISFMSMGCTLKEGLRGSWIFRNIM